MKTTREKVITEDEIADLILANYKYFGKVWITKNDVRDFMIKSNVLSAIDLEKSKSRNEPKYVQVIGNLISHRNNNFVFVESNIIDGCTFIFKPSTLKFNYQINELDLNPEFKNKANKTIFTSNKYVSDMGLKKMLKEINEYKCFYGCGEEMYFKSISGENYVEAHHLIPLSLQGNFDFNLDVKDNIVISCSKHHKLFHFGDKDELVKIYNYLPKNNIDFLKLHNIEFKMLYSIPEE